MGVNQKNFQKIKGIKSRGKPRAQGRGIIPFDSSSLGRRESEYTLTRSSLDEINSAAPAIVGAVFFIVYSVFCYSNVLLEFENRFPEKRGFLRFRKIVDKKVIW